MGNKNTPGKLEFNAQANTLRDERGLVADCNGMPPHYRDLFLAAPELLAALAEMPCIICETMVGAPPKPPGIPGIKKCPGCDVARAALARARGE